MIYCAKRHIFLTAIVVLTLFTCIPAFPKITGTITSLQYPLPGYNYSYPDTNIIDMGMCMQGDTIITYFKLVNTGDSIVSIKDHDPSFYLGKTQKGTLEYELLKYDLGSQFISPGDAKTIGIVYRTKNDVTDPVSKSKEALLKLGLYFQDTCNGTSQSEMLVSKYYKLVFRKTNKLLDGFENIKILDSVYINPTDTLRYNWIVQNSSMKGLSVSEQDTNWLVPRYSGQASEFYFKFYPLPMSYQVNQKYSQNTWQIGYYPTDTVKDAIELKLKYTDIETGYVDFVTDTIKAFGVVQDIMVDETHTQMIPKIYEKIVNGKKYTVLDLGQIPRQPDCFFLSYPTLQIINNGNIVLTADSIRLLNETNDNPSTEFTFFNNDRITGTPIPNGGTGWYSFRLMSQEAGIHTARLVIYSDIYKKNIFGYPSDARKIEFLIRAECVEPIMALNHTTVDYKNVVISPDCPKKILDSVKVYNNGNANLNIKNIRIDTKTTPFAVTPNNFILEPGTGSNIYISFNTDGLDVNTQYDAKLRIESETCPDSITVVSLTAKTVEAASTTMRLPEVKAMPGRVVSFPLLVDGEKIQIARTFRDTIVFEKYLLSYQNYENVGTASAKANIIEMSEFKDGMLAVNIKMAGSEYFSASDTLIILKFNTYLGNKISTPISFLNPELGDGICSKVMSIVKTDGLFTLDSVCGLENKAIPSVVRNFSILSARPNPADDEFRVQFSLSGENRCSFNLYDLYGQKVFSIPAENLSPGEYETRIDSSVFTHGIYYLEMTDGFFCEIIKIVVTR